MLESQTAIAMKVIDRVETMQGYWGANLKCRFANAAYAKWLGRSPQDLLGFTAKDLFGPRYEANLTYIQGALNGEVQVFEQEMLILDGSVRHGLTAYYPDVSNSVIQGFSVEITDISKMKRRELELQTAITYAELLATHDFLTGLPNRVLLMDRISAATARARRTCGTAGIVVIDLDQFKSVNDTYGHDFGDEVLRQIANRMKASIRAADTITRLGGDEFVFLTTELKSAGDLELAINRLMDAVCQPVQFGALKTVPSFRYGMAIYPTDGAGAVELLASADRALYRAKRRNEVSAGLLPGSASPYRIEALKC